MGKEKRLKRPYEWLKVSAKTIAKLGVANFKRALLLATLSRCFVDLEK
jgi:hypothetical protein